MKSSSFSDHFENPRHLGRVSDPDGVGIAGDDECDDRVEVGIKVHENGLISAYFKGEGCPSTIAGVSAVCELSTGKDIFFAASLKEKDIAGHLGLDGNDYESERCIGLGLLALTGAIGDAIVRRSRTGKKLGNVRDRLVAVAMSGGVDSSVAALILKREGNDVVGITAKLLSEYPDAPASCCSPAEITDARKVCESLGIPHFTVDLSEEFKSAVIDSFCSSYLAGKTPNPCVECNGKVRFRSLLQAAETIGAKWLATGHYVKIVKGENGSFELRRSIDLTKDQSYLFWQADQEVLSRLLAPIGNLTKAEVRSIARKANLSVADKEESMEICFIPDNDYRTFLVEKANYTPAQGPIVDRSGKKLGQHKGYAFYTVGQRKGLGIAHANPLYVTKIDPENNLLEVGERVDLVRKNLTASNVNYVNGQPFPSSGLKVMTRYRSRMVPVLLEKSDTRSLKLNFPEETGAISPGQSVVIFQGDKVLGGGIIEQ